MALVVLSEYGYAPVPGNVQLLYQLTRPEFEVLAENIDWTNAVRNYGVVNAAIMGDDALAVADEHVAPLVCQLLWTLDLIRN